MKVKMDLATATRTVKEYLIITVGVALYAFAWVGIIIPADGIGGGASGLSLLIYYVTGATQGGIPMGVSFFVINALLLITATFTLGAKFGAKTIYAIVLISLLMNVFQETMPLNLLGLGSDKLLSAILGGAVSGFGIGVCLLQGGSTGGGDIIAMIVNKYRNVSYSRVVVTFDVIVIGCSYFIFKDISTIIYGYIVVVLAGVTVDTVLSGSKQSMQLLIMSDSYETIADMVTNELHRGATILDGTGWYTKRPVKVVMVVCRKTEMGMLLRKIKECDPKAFITVASVMGVFGKGFETYRR